MTTFRIICDPENFVLVFVNVLTAFCTTFFTSYLSVYVLKEYNLDGAFIGLVFSLFALVYVICCVLAPILLAKVPPKIQFTASLYLIAIGISLFGPSWLFDYPNEYWLMCCNCLFTGVGFCLS